MPDLLSLISEISASSKSYADANGIDRTDDWFLLKTGEEFGEMMQAYLRLTDRARRLDATHVARHAAFSDEVADLLGMALLLVDRFDIDIVPALEKKWRMELRKTA
jgi:NTP pyrophosphatase (non-canonical NTP hydrolase)